ncbi:DUF5662 family protein [Microscilla marina]|uniref:Uncharacterized protein n=1 Tax=Microscilla marina ATCC 23134 TaxID=313606 RepID=A1ZCL1_MICM2|nr:DUF5662 family protein [Microscilla marina]EAY32013.1 hypothetical protein M23134_02042 [Microscilla marina ATCC 23134]
MKHQDMDTDKNTDLSTTENEIRKHILLVRDLLNKMVVEILKRSNTHDQSKLSSPEIEYSMKYTQKLKDADYGSPEYLAIQDEMNEALEHHYACNRHHPEHFEGGIQEMNLIDILEMFCDWAIASQQHPKGDIEQSIEVNQQRFGYSDDLKEILRNSIKLLK